MKRSELRKIIKEELGKFEHHGGEYPPELLNMTVSNFLDRLKEIDETKYNQVESIIDDVMGQITEGRFKEGKLKKTDGDKIVTKAKLKSLMESEEDKPVLKLVGQDGNAFAILGRAMRVAKKNGLDWDKIKKEATSGDYDHLLQTMMKYFDVE